MSIIPVKQENNMAGTNVSKYTEAIIDALVYFPLFDGITGQDLKILAKHMNFFEIPEGEILFREGEKGDSICFVVDGELDIIKKSSQNENVVISTLSKGRSIGEMSVIDNFPRSASVRARAKTSYITLTREGFETVLKDKPQIGIQILKGMSRLLSQNLRKTSSRLADYMLPVT